MSPIKKRPQDRLKFTQTSLFDVVKAMKSRGIEKKLKPPKVKYQSIIIDIDSDNENLPECPQEPCEERKLPFNLDSDDDNNSPTENYSQLNSLAAPSLKLRKIDPDNSRTSSSLDDTIICDYTKTVLSPSKNSNSENIKEEIETNIKEENSSAITSLNDSLESPEKKQINMATLKVFIEMLQDLNGSPYFKYLLKDNQFITDFLQLDEMCQFVCLKLFVWQRKWYQLIPFCERHNMNLLPEQYDDIFKELLKKGYIHNDLMSETTLNLLNLVQLNDLKVICNQFKVPIGKGKKDDLINKIMKITKTQGTLSFVKVSVEEKIRQQVRTIKGEMMKFNQSVHDTFYKAFLLSTFTNYDMKSINDYFAIKLNTITVLPQFKLQNIELFKSEDDFLRFAEARNKLDKVENLTPSKDYEELFEIADNVFTNLQSIIDDPSNPLRENPLMNDYPYLKRYTEEAVFINILTNASKMLTTRHYETVSKWLRFLIDHYEDHSKFGNWVHLLAHIQTKYLSPTEEEMALEMILKTLENKETTLSDIQIHDLKCLAKNLLKMKKLKIAKETQGKVEAVSKDIVDSANFNSTTIDAQARRSDQSGAKRLYSIIKLNGDRLFVSVEQVALDYYISQGHFTQGLHVEGAIIKCLFLLAFWDIIYKDDVPNTFVQATQICPLDMFSKYFYKNRKELIDDRLKNIESTWSEIEYKEHMRGNYLNNKNVLSLCILQNTIDQIELLDEWLDCIGRPLLCNIFRRLRVNLRLYFSGLPDLFVWNRETKKCKFVEVKGEGDRLSTKQTLWIDFMQSAGADVEVCHVHTTGSRRTRSNGRIRVIPIEQLLG